MSRARESRDKEDIAPVREGDKGRANSILPMLLSQAGRRGLLGCASGMIGSALASTLPLHPPPTGRLLLKTWTVMGGGDCCPKGMSRALVPVQVSL